MPDRISMDFNDVSVSPRAAKEHAEIIMFPHYDDVKIVDREGKILFEGSFVVANLHGVVVVTHAEYSELQRLRAQRGEGKEGPRTARGPTF